VRFGDGEKNIINNIACNRQGFSYDPGDCKDREFQNDLIESLEYMDDNYFVGINDERLEKRVNGTIISPMIFVNENYLPFLNKIIPLCNNCVLVANERGNRDTLPFEVLDYVKIKNTYWRYVDSLLVDVSISYLLFDKPTQIVLVAGGPWSNVLIQRFWETNKNHIYIDIGSTLDPFLYRHNTRQYQERLKNDT